MNNAFLFADAVLLPNYDLSAFRLLAALAGVSILVFGLVWEAE